MPAHRSGRYPQHLAKLVAKRLDNSQVSVPSGEVLLKLFETLYFASLKTDEARPCRCTVNYFGPAEVADFDTAPDATSGWIVIPFHHRIPLSVRSLVKLADAADPTVSSVAVCSDENDDLFIWAMVDQEIRYGEYVSLNATNDPQRAGSFQATITGVGAVSAYKDFTLLGSLEQDNLIEDYHDVLWDGPVYERLRENLEATLREENIASNGDATMAHAAQVKEELLIRWQNAICRILFNIQQYGHGGGLLIAPECPVPDANVKYKIKYDRLPSALLRLAQNYIVKRQTGEFVSSNCPTDVDMMPRDVHDDAIQSHRLLDEGKNELLGCIRFIASLSRVDGFVLLDKSLIVHGFGVEARADPGLTHVDVAGDASASGGHFRRIPLSQFGTRHRAMLRYCSEHEGALGFVISQDGDIRATMKHRGKLVLWENINVQLAYRAENRGELIDNFSSASIARLFAHWTSAFTKARSA